MGVYEAKLNGRRVGQFVMAPGWTSYHKRLQYQEYDITDLLTNGKNEIEVTVGKAGIEVRFLDGLAVHIRMSFALAHAVLLHRLHLPLKTAAAKSLSTDENWKVSDGL